MQYSTVLTIVSSSQSDKTPQQTAPEKISGCLSKEVRSRWH